MATSQISEVIRHLRRTVLLRDVAGLTDGQLLEDFISRRDGEALEALVQRHGPMVWGVCCRVLSNHHDAEDAFQVTFLVLVRKAASIASRELLPNWMYGVAYQTALKARATTAKRRGRERQVTEMPEPEAVQQEIWHDLQPLLDQELSRLPDKYRIPIVLCDLEGKTRKEAAQQLGCPEGTVAGRLARAREMLAKRLVQHGLLLSSGSLALLLSQNAALACLPPSVVTTTIKTATLIVAGQTAATGLIPAKVAALTEGVLKAMLMNKIKNVTLVVAMLCMVAFGGGLLTHHIAAGQQPQIAAEAHLNRQADDPGDLAAFVVPDRKPLGGPDSVQPNPPFTNSLGMKFVWIPPGSFMMGSPKDEYAREDDETKHKVTLTKGFYMGVYTVTQEQWKEVMGSNPSNFKGEKNLPVENVSWDDCQEFIKKLREKDKKLYRLPTEAEWEYSCRAGTKTPFHFGDTISTDQANYNGNYIYGDPEKKLNEEGAQGNDVPNMRAKDGDGMRGRNREKTTPVGSFPANAWGLHDMHGNILQWCQDWYGDYPEKDVVDPPGAEEGKFRVLRGGLWRDNIERFRSASRHFGDPGRSNNRIGLRVCFCLD